MRERAVMEEVNRFRLRGGMVMSIVLLFAFIVVVSIIYFLFFTM